MKLVFEIVPDSSGFTKKIISPDYSKLKFSLDNEKGKSKFKVSGAITLSGPDYDFFIDTVGSYDYIINAYYKSDLYFSCSKKFTNTPKIDISFNKIDLGLTAETQYTGEAWKSFDTKYNINELTPETNDLYFLPGYLPITTDPVGVHFYDIEINPADLSPFERADWDIDYGAVLSSYQTLGVWYYHVVVIYKRVRAYGYYIGSTRYDPDGVIYVLGKWSYLYNQTFSNTTLPVFHQIITPIYTMSGSSEPYNGFDNTANFYDKPVIEYTGVTRKVSDVIEWLTSQMGLSLSFDSGGTSTDSFYSFKSMTGESLSYGSTSDKLYSHLLIMNLTDFIPADDDGQNDVPAAQTNISLKTILDYFETLNFEWFIEDRSGTNYFILQHKSQKSLGSGNPDLLNYKGKNWLRLANKWKKEHPKYHKIKNEQTCKSIDFVGTEIIFNNIYGVETNLTYSDNKIYTDLDDISVRRADVYSDSDVENVVIIAAQKYGTTKDYVRQSTGLRTGIRKNNNELSFSYCGKYIYGSYPSDDYWANGGNHTASVWQLEKRNKIEINLPADNMQNDYDINNYIDTFGENSEIDKIEQNADNNILKLTLKK